MSDRQDEFSKNLDNLVDEFKQKLNLNQLIDWADWVSQFDPADPELKSEVKTHVSVRSLSSIPPRGNIPRQARASGSPATASTINVESPQPNPTQTMHETVGGLGETLKQLRNLVEIPLKHPEILEKLGIEPPRGVLLVGAPGTGKTLTARSLAQTLGVNYIALVAPEIISKYYGEAEAKLREVFAQAAKSQPCLIFIDEIDALMPNRASVEGEVEKRVVAQMLGLMDGFGKNHGVIVLAATNLPDALDPALRRPGRFDREIMFPLPDQAARREILAIHTRSMPLAPDLNLEAIADLAHGFVGADLKGLCQAAAYQALQRQVTDLGAVPEYLQISKADFDFALTKVKPAVLRSLALESPQVQWSEIGGLAQIKQNLQEAVSGSFGHPALYAHAKAVAPKGILLSGAPGTGKTLLAKAIATEGKANFIAIAAPELLSKWVGGSEQAIRQLFTQARQAAPCVIFIDEIDTLAPARGTYQGDSGVSDRAIGQLLTELDGMKSSAGILLVAATNRKESIDPALLRSGRLELHITVELPDLTGRKDILTIHNSDRPLAPDLDLDKWASLTTGCNGADLAFLSNRAAIFAIRRHHPSQPTANLQITNADFDKALTELNQQRHVQI